MTLQETMTTLEKLGKEQTRKTYRRHGAGDNLFGVSFADFGKLQKKIRRDHALARQLWDTGNEDARCLALMIADPAQASEKELDAWAGSITWKTHADLFAQHVVSKASCRHKMMDRWRKSKTEYVSRLGWDLVTLAARNDAGLPESYFEERLKEIEAGIHQAPNLARSAMNGALIGIGLRNEGLKRKALAAAKKIGKVVVDHGDTDCRTPDAAAYIEKASARKKAAVC